MLGGALVTHLYRLAEAHLVAQKYPSVPSLDGGGHSLALEREQRVLEVGCRRHSRTVRETRHGDAASFWSERYQRTLKELGTRRCGGPSRQ